MKKGFTLVELMVVVAIMALMMGAAISGFGGIGQGAKMKSSIAQLRSNLSLARQHAITRRSQTSLVFFSSNGVYNSFAVYGSYAGTNEYLSEVHKLPDGVYFDAVNSDGNNVFQEAFMTNIPRPLGAVGLTNVHRLAFTPNGSLRDDRDVRLYLMRAVNESGVLVAKADGHYLQMYAGSGHFKLKTYTP